MASLTIHAITRVTPEQFVAALTDFGSNRGNIWGNSQPEYLNVHEKGDTWANITEGSGVFGGAWERVYYDWSQPGIIKLRTIESNLWKEGSGWHYSLQPFKDGSGTQIKYTVTRYARNKKGRLVMLFVGSLGRPLLKRSFRQTIRAIEASQ